jgi:hypothetical protein
MAGNEAAEPTPLTPEHENDVLLMLDTVRAEIIEEVKGLAQMVQQPRPHDPALQGTLNTVARLLDTPQDTALQTALEDVLHRLAQLHPPKRLPWYVLPACVVLAGLLGLGLGWQTSRCEADVRLYGGLMGQVDAVLSEQYATLPPAVQRAVAQLYTKAGLQPPGQRKGSK